MRLFNSIGCVVICLAIVLSVAGCAGNEPSKQTTDGGTNASTPVLENKEQVFSINETAVFETLKITATEMKESKGKSFFEPEAGNVFIGVNFTIENISNEEQSISSILLFDAYADDISCDQSFTAATVFGKGVDGTIAPGKKIIGWYAVEAPENWQKLELDVKASWLSNTDARFVFTK